MIQPPSPAAFSEGGAGIGIGKAVLGSAANSLVGSQIGNQVGYGGLTALSNENYLVSCPRWGMDEKDP